MTPQTKKILLIGGSLLAIAAGIAIYSHRKNKPENIDTGEGESKDENKDTSGNTYLIPDYSSGGSSYTPRGSGRADVQEPKKETKIVKLDDVLAGGIKDANGKKIYPIIDGLKFYNLEGNESGKTVKNKLLGTIAIVTKDSKGTKMVYFLGTNGVKYKMPSIGLNVAI